MNLLTLPLLLAVQSDSHNTNIFFIVHLSQMSVKTVLSPVSYCSERPFTSVFIHVSVLPFERVHCKYVRCECPACVVLYLYCVRHVRLAALRLTRTTTF